MIDIADHLEPFWDHHLIDRLDEAHLQLHAPTPREVVLRFDRPWEGMGVGYPTILRDGHTYRLYYRGWPTTSDHGTANYCLAESDDGVHFQRPAVNEHTIAGTRENNVVLTGGGAHNLAPFIDTNPDARASQRYKAVGSVGHGKERGLAAFASPDGIHWSLMQEAPVFTKGAFDSQNLAFWSEHEDCYVCYFRIFTDSGFEREERYKGIRTIARTTSEDFLHWSEPEPMTFGDTPMEHLYTNATTPYFRAPHIYVALPKRFVPDRAALSTEQFDAFGVASGQRTAISEAVFMTSRGGTAYDRTFMEALIRPGLDQRNWVGRNRMCAWGVVPTGDDEISIYCQEHYTQPTHNIRRFTLRTDGFASVRAPYRGGEMTTKPFTFAGKTLAMNYATSAAGSVRVEVQDESGKPIAGLTLDDATTHYGDRIAQTVSWKSSAGERTDLSDLAGKPIRLRFVMADADLYAIRFR
ncbi:MAG: hypothetical protein ACODAQ_01380 [Phycisphaeraceae bacterium]